MGKIVLACQTTELKWSVAWRAVGLGGRAGVLLVLRRESGGLAGWAERAPEDAAATAISSGPASAELGRGHPSRSPGGPGPFAGCFHGDGSSLPQCLGAGFNLPLETNRGKESQHLTCGRRALRGRVQTVQTGSAPETSSVHPRLLRYPLPSHSFPVSVFLSHYFPSICVDVSLKPLSLWPSK